MSNKAKQRFVELEVGEVSIVDSPANEKEFAVIKNLNEEVGDMADDNVKKNMDESESEAQQDAPEKVSVEVDKATDKAVAKAMGQVTEMISNISKAVGAATEKSESKPEGAEKSEKQDGEESTEETGDAEVQKDKENADAQEASEDVSEDNVEKTLTALAQAVEKAKRFTPKREAALKAALAQLTTLAKELGMTEIPVGASPPVSTPKGATFGASSTGVSKALEELTGKLNEALAGIQETTKGLTERVEKMEETRMPSKSVDGEGGTDTQKTNKSFWAGVL
jgi:hypothetical protein